MSLFLSLIRPRTLPLAFVVILCGNALAFYAGNWRIDICLLSLLTALSLQILSNISNDYGDGIRGTDDTRSKHHPKRLTGQGIISPQLIKYYIIFCLIITLALGIILITISTQSLEERWIFILLGAFSAAAALGYTLGRYAYSYHGLGEVAVFIFFGWVGVIGSYVLQTGELSAALFLPASGAGLLAAVVLNVNNIRDIDGDRLAGKHTLAVRLGFIRSRFFHAGLLLTAVLCYLLFSLFYIWQSALFLFALPILRRHGKAILTTPTPILAAKELKTAVQLNILVNSLFVIGVLIAAWKL